MTYVSIQFPAVLAIRPDSQLYNALDHLVCSKVKYHDKGVYWLVDVIYQLQQHRPPTAGTPHTAGAVTTTSTSTITSALGRGMSGQNGEAPPPEHPQPPPPLLPTIEAGFPTNDYTDNAAI